MSVETANYREVIERLPTDSTLILRGISWDDYEELLAAVGEAPGLRISYDQGTMQIMTPSSEHESYVRLIERLVDRLSSKLRIKVLSFGSATMKHSRWRKGSEPDACFYVQSASRIGNRVLLDFTNDPPPDIVVEVDINHDSLSKFPIYAALGVSEIWRYDGQALAIYLLEHNQYIPSEASLALPMLTSAVLTEFLSRSRSEDQYETLIEFEIWLEGRSK
jgi:Uma2 family endonuclease